jgi:hypothetical protein
MRVLHIASRTSMSGLALRDLYVIELTAAQTLCHACSVEPTTNELGTVTLVGCAACPTCVDT